MNQSGERVNKITARIESDGVVLTLYRTHKKLGTITNADIGIPDYKDSKATNKNLYIQYCKEALIVLLEGGGIEGFYYDPINRNEESAGRPRKFKENTFLQWGRDYLHNVLSDIHQSLAGVAVEFNIDDDDDEGIEVQIDERYKDGYIKYAEAQYGVSLEDPNGNIKMITIPVQIKSGQLSKPKNMIFNNKTMALNPTNIRSIMGGDKPKSPGKSHYDVELDPASVDPIVYDDYNEDRYNG